MKVFIKELAQLPEEQQKTIKEGLQKQIIAQAIFVRDEQPTKYLAYIDEEIGKANTAMLKMIQESSLEGAELGAISEIYIWNKERKKALIRLKDAFLQSQPEQHTKPQRLLPDVLATDEAKRYFEKAIDLKLMDADYNWLKGLQMLACFAREMSIKLQLGKGANSDGNPRISWKPFEILFNQPAGKLRLNYNDIQKTGQGPIEIGLIDRVFEK